MKPGLYRTTVAMPGHEDEIPAHALVFVGEDSSGAAFIVRPGQNRRNRWFWARPTIALTPLLSSPWCDTLLPLPREGFYTLPEALTLPRGGRWRENAIVQLGYNRAGQGILFVAEDHEGATENVLAFSSRGQVIDDSLLNRLLWAPTLPVSPPPPVDDELIN